MRISDWSSDVCSSDLPCCLCPASVRYGPVTVPWAQVMPKARRGDVSQRVRLIMEHHFGETNCPAGEKYHKRVGPRCRSEEHTSELQSLMRISYADFCLQNKHTNT